MDVPKAEAIVDSLRKALLWEEGPYEEPEALKAAERLLAYRAHGEREGHETYNCLCTSTYRYDGGRWLIILHQQTPV